MRKIILLLSILAATGSLSQAQKINPKNLNTVIAWSATGKDANFRKAVAACISQGFGIHYSDIDIGVITTTHKPITGSSSAMLNIIATDSTVIFRGQLLMSVSIDIGSVTAEASPSEIKNKGQKGSPLRESWNAIEAVAREVGDSLTYEIR